MFAASDWDAPIQAAVTMLGVIVAGVIVCAGVIGYVIGRRRR